MKEEIVKILYRYADSPKNFTMPRVNENSFIPVAEKIEKEINKVLKQRKMKIKDIIFSLLVILLVTCLLAVPASLIALIWSENWIYLKILFTAGLLAFVLYMLLHALDEV